MALLERRPRRRRQRQVGQNTEGLGRVLLDDQEMMDSVKNSDCVERLAHKYMQKCVVESSTESESESSMEGECKEWLLEFQLYKKFRERTRQQFQVFVCSSIQRIHGKMPYTSMATSLKQVLHNPLAEGLRKARDSKGLQFLDPYDGDSEDTSVHSDCSLSSLNSAEALPRVSSAPKAMSLGDADPSGDGRSFPQSLDRLCSETNISDDVHSQRVSDGRTPLELPSQQEDFPRSLSQSSELMRRTEAFPCTWLMPDPSLLVGVNPSARADLLAGAGGSSPQAMLAGDCDGTKPPLIKRKQGVSISESAGEKLPRKKIRAI